MMSKLQRIRILGLYGYRDIDARVEDDTLIIVGENGSGKTTFLRIVFYFLSGRWISLLNFRFEAVVATIDGIDLRVGHDQIKKAFSGNERRMLHTLPPSLRKRFAELMALESDRSYAELTRLSSRYGLPPNMLLSEMELSEDNPRGPKKMLQELAKKIRESMNAQILYLPTYRRIERELKSIFEGIDQDDIRKQRFSRRQDETGDAYIELVEFGMKDVQEAIDRTLEQLKDFARENLNNLTLNYLGDVVNREYQKVDMAEVANAREETVRAVLSRIHESILTRDDKIHLFGVITSVARTAGAPSEHEKIICHYFLKLLRFQEALREREGRISKFCALCSEYIVDKEFSYDSVNFNFNIRSMDPWNAGADVDLSDLSSGEKQIVSLFSHLYLSGQNQFFVLIDEPELSLSVPWQRRFLADIRSGSFCAGLIAVTHSPFIYDNVLKPYAHSLGEFQRQ